MLVFMIIGLVLIGGAIALAIITEKKGWFLIGIIGAIVFFFGDAVTIVPSGYMGVKTAYGQISDEPVKQGLNWHTPFAEQIHLVNCKQQEIDFKDLQIWSETAERTEMYCENVIVDYQINSEYAAWIWQNVEEWDTNLVKQTSVESGIKSATKQFNDTDVTDRSKIEGAAREGIQKSLNEKYGEQIVNVVFVTIGNINFSDAYNAAIEKKAQAKLAAEADEYTNKVATQKAQAEAEQKKIKAEAEAEAIRIQAEAEAEANKKIAESLTKELIEKEKVEKWDGKLPTIQGSAGTIVDFSEAFTQMEEDKQ